MNQNKQPKILIVDDELSDVLIMKEMLSELDVHCMAVSSAKEALALVEEEQGISLMLLDIHMPDMNGFELALKLRAMPFYRETPIVFVSASNDDQAEIAAYEYGAIDYICKPVSPYVFRAKVTLHIKLFHAYLDSLEATEALEEFKEMLKKATALSADRLSQDVRQYERLFNHIQADHQAMFDQLNKVYALNKKTLGDIRYYPCSNGHMTTSKEREDARNG